MHTARDVISKYGCHIRHLRIAVRDTRSEYRHSEVESYYQLILDTLDACQNTTSLALYYASSESPLSETFISNLNDRVTRMITKGSLSTLGVYSFSVITVGYSWYRVPRGIPALLKSVIPAIASTPSFKHLEIASESIPSDVYDDLRSKTASLHSLTLRSCISSPLEKAWSPGNTQKWVPNANLTYLLLSNCQSVYPPHIPNLVQHFTSLKHLMISACGSHGDVVPPARAPNWCTLPDALWKQRPPLETAFIEHMLQWEIIAMGTIPAKTVIFTSIRRGNVETSFMEDPEIFPCLFVLRVEPDDTWKGRLVRAAGRPQSPIDWHHLLSGRKIRLEKNAKWIINSR